MVTIHEKQAQTFQTLGLGTLLPGSCVVMEELNGAYELEMKHPYDEGGKWQRLERGRILYASTPRGMQPFRIYYVKPTMDEITVNARHIFYDLLDNQCKPISHSGTAGAALTAIQAAFAYPMPFSFDTDITLTGTLTTGRLNPIQVLLSDEDEVTSFVKGYGGELHRDGFHASLKTTLGQDRGAAIRYGKNLVGLEVTEDESEVRTRIACCGENGTATVDSPYLSAYLYPKIYTLEDESKSLSELRQEAQALLDGGCDIPSINIKVDFVALAKTVEYREYAVLEEVFLGDWVTVVHSRMGFHKRAKVISYEWDCLLERYNTVELGDFIPTLASSVTSGVKSGSLASAAAVGTAAVSAALQAHLQDYNNPHHVPTGGGTGNMTTAVYDPRSEKRDVFAHERRRDNPHGVTAAQVGARPDTWLPTAGQIGVSNPNLLDNWYFGNPVNQRGKTEYPGNANYTIDRWWGQYDTNLKIKDDGIVMDGSWNIDQHLENTLPNGTYTLSVLFKEHKGTDVLRAIIGNKATGDINVNATYESDGLLSVTATSDKINRLTFGFAGKGTDSVKLIAAKLELGSLQTLAHKENGQWVLNEIPNYAEELAKCQRYLLPIDGVGRYPATISGTADTVQIFVPTPVTLRSAPSISGSFNVSFCVNTGAYNTTSFAVSSTLLTAAGFLILGTAVWSSGKPSVYQGGVAVLTDKVFALAEL